MGWHTPDEYFERHVLPGGDYETVRAELGAAADRLEALSAEERQALAERGKHCDHYGRFDRILLEHGREATLAFLDQAQARYQARLAEAAAERAARPPTVGLAERAVWVVMQLDGNYRDLKHRQGADGDSGPAQVFLRGFDPSITFQSARLDLTAETISALTQMRQELEDDGFFTVCSDRHLEEDSQILIDKLRARLAENAGSAASAASA